MPFLQNHGANIYWDERGAGDPVLMIMGLSYPSYMWHRTRPVVSTAFRTIAFDNRGVGQSDVPPGPYPIPLMAADAAAVLDAAGVESAHVVAFSMGGMIAQEFALHYPNRVRSLVLGATMTGGREAVQPELAVIQILMAKDLTPTQATDAIIPVIYDKHTPRKRIDEDMEIRLKWYPTPQGYLAQLQGIMMWGGTWSRISRIAAPTLLIHGETDRLIPPVNANMLAERIPGATLVTLPHASHIFTTDQTEPALHALMQFLRAQAAVGAQSRGTLQT